uniref:Secreted protein n=1 Tax=Opuntia streptacantha TaxID=393608 RepID=A0A7C9AHA4_OPUST
MLMNVFLLLRFFFHLRPSSSLLPVLYYSIHRVPSITTPNYSLQPFDASTTFNYLSPSFWKSTQTPSTLVPTTRSTKCPPSQPNPNAYQRVSRHSFCSLL